MIFFLEAIFPLMRFRRERCDFVALMPEQP